MFSLQDILYLESVVNTEFKSAKAVVDKQVITPYYDFLIAHIELILLQRIAWATKQPSVYNIRSISLTEQQLKDNKSFQKSVSNFRKKIATASSAVQLDTPASDFISVRMQNASAKLSSLEFKTEFNSDKNGCYISVSW